MDVEPKDLFGAIPLPFWKPEYFSTDECPLKKRVKLNLAI